MFTSPKLGGFAFGEILTSAQMNQFNTDHPNTIDGLDGGEYNPTSALLLGGMFSPTALSVYNVKSYGAELDGITDDTTALTDTIAAAAADPGGGGVVYVPAGSLLTSSAVAWTAGVSFLGAGSGASSIVLDHASANMFTLTTTGRRFMRGLALTHEQANSGNILAVSGASAITHVTVRDCAIGSGDSDGNLVTIAGSPTAHRISFLNNRFLISGATNRAISCTDTTSNIVLAGNEFFMNQSTYNGALVNSSGHVQATGNTFSFSDHTSGTLVALQNDNAAGSLAVSGNRFYFGTGAGGTEYGAGWVTSARVNIGANSWFPTQGTHRRYTASGVAEQGSSIADLDYADATISGTTATVPDGFGTYAIDSTNATAPTVTLPTKLFPGQRLTLSIRNGSGGNWGGAYVFTGANAVSNVYVEALVNLQNGEVGIHDFIVIDIDNGGTYAWVRWLP